MTPLRQFKGVPQDIIRKAEGKQFVGYINFREMSAEIYFIFSHGIGTLI